MSDLKNDPDYIFETNRMIYAAEVLGNKRDLLRAQAGQRIVAVTDTLVEARLWAVRHLDGVTVGRAALLVRLAQALDVVGEDMFLAIGWDGVRELLKLDGVERERVAAESLAEHKRIGKQLSRVRYLKISGQEPQKKAAVPTVTATGPTARERLLAKELRKLLFVCGVNEIMSAEARALVDEIAPVAVRA